MSHPRRLAMAAAMLGAQLLMGQAPSALAPAAAPQAAAASATAAAPADDALTAIRDDTLRQHSRLMFEEMAWGEASLIVSGLAFLVARGPFARGFELQLAFWGAAEIAATAVNLVETKRHWMHLDGMETWIRLRDQMRRDARLDGLVALGGLVSALVSWKLCPIPRWRGTGAGLALQLGFLTLFNLLASLAFGG